MDDKIYKKTFDLILKNTNEKEVIIRNIKKEVKLNDKTKFLDIGGGNGSLAIPISQMVGKTVVVEPNKHFVRELSGKKNIKYINKKWEDADIGEKFNFILAAYVVTHFSSRKVEPLIVKMLDNLEDGGKMIILAVDERLGSWRGVHSYFYKRIGENKKSSTVNLKSILKKHKAKKVNFETKVKARDMDEMLEILTFDFGRYGNKFYDNADYIKKYLNKNRVSEYIELEMSHQMFIVSK